MKDDAVYLCWLFSRARREGMNHGTWKEGTREIGKLANPHMARIARDLQIKKSFYYFEQRFVNSTVNQS